VIVGTAEEPDVYLDKAHVNFRALLVSHRVQERVAIINQEQSAFAFQLDKSSFASEDKSLSVVPTKGVIPPGGSQMITVSFVPKFEKKYNFNVNIKIPTKSTGTILFLVCLLNPNYTFRVDYECKRRRLCYPT
jgi:hypothetical protein